MKYAAIPTTYNGVNFRSRLEARWAVFFDLLHWSWKYEPLDLNGWIPDFEIIGKTRTLVEVKPYIFDYFDFYYGSWSETSICKNHSDSIHKITKAGCPLALFLGREPFYDEGRTILGIKLFNIKDEDDDFYFLTDTKPQFLLGHDGEERLQKRIDCPIFDFGSCFSSNYYPNENMITRSCHIEMPVVSKEVTEKIWKEAGNEVQWKK